MKPGVRFSKFQLLEPILGTVVNNVPCKVRRFSARIFATRLTLFYLKLKKKTVRWIVHIFTHGFSFRSVREMRPCFCNRHFSDPNFKHGTPALNDQERSDVDLMWVWHKIVEGSGLLMNSKGCMWLSGSVCFLCMREPMKDWNLFGKRDETATLTY